MKKRNYFIWPKYSLLNGELLLLLLDAHQLNAYSTMNSYSIVLREEIRWTLTIQGVYVLVRLILIQRPNHLGLILLIWMKMKKRCFKSAELVLLILKERKLNARAVKSNSKKPEGWLNYKSNVN